MSTIVDLINAPHQRPHQILKYLAKKHDVTVIGINDWWRKKDYGDERQFEEYLVSDYTYYSLTQKKISPIIQEVLSPIFLPPILEHIDFNSFDLFFNYNTLFLGNFISKKFKKLEKPVIFDIADDLGEMIRSSPQIPTFFLRYFGGIIGKTIIRKNIDLADKITITIDSLAFKNSIPAKKCIVIPNGVDLDLFNFDPKARTKYRNFFTFRDETMVIGYVGGLREWLDFNIVFRAIKRLKIEGVDIKFIITGREGNFSQIVKKAINYGIRDIIIFTGYLPYTKVPGIISAMDFCLIPFKRGKIAENALPLKLFEYIACNRPVIAINVPAIKNIAKGSVKFAYDVNSLEEQLLNSYQRFVNNNMNSSLTQSQRNIVLDYSWKSIIDKLELEMKHLINFQ